MKNILRTVNKIFILTIGFFGLGQLLSNVENLKTWFDFGVAVLWGISFYVIANFYKKHQLSKHQEQKLD